MLGVRSRCHNQIYSIFSWLYEESYCSGSNIFRHVGIPAASTSFSMPALTIVGEWEYSHLLEQNGKKYTFFFLVWKNIKPSSYSLLILRIGQNIYFISNDYALVLYLNKLTNQNCSCNLLTFKWFILIDRVKPGKEWWKLIMEFG